MEDVCIALKGDGKRCNRKCVPGKKFCDGYHKKCLDYTDEQIARCGVCSKCRSYAPKPPGMSVCDFCRPKMFEDNRKKSLQKKADKKEKNRCGGIRQDGTRCDRYIDGVFCKYHKYMEEYTEQEMKLLNKCSGCLMYKNIDEGTTCYNCRNRRKNNHVSGRKKIDDANKWCRTCLNNDRQVEGSTQINGEWLCKLHIRSAEIKATGKQICSRQGCNNAVMEGYIRCELCVENSRKTDSKCKKKVSKLQARNNELEKLYEDGDLDILDNANDERYCTYPSTVNERRKSTLTACQMKGCNLYFTPYLTHTGFFATKCRSCMEKQTAVEEKRPERTNRQGKMTEERKARKRELQKERRLEGKLSYTWYRLDKRVKDLTSFLKHNAHIMKTWMDNNPEYREIANDKQRKNPNRKLTDYKRRAKDAGREFTLTDKEALDLIKSEECHYCGGIEEGFTNGIDRIDSDNGYERDNTVTCCRRCNMMKNTFNYIQFICMCEHIATRLDGYKGSLYPDMFVDCPTGGSFSDYKRNAPKRKGGIEFALEKMDFYAITYNDCYICGKKNTDDHRNGIDRVDNDIGYIYKNCQACCGSCNYMKGASEFSTFIDHCTQITKHMKDNLSKEYIPACIDYDMIKEVFKIDDSDSDSDSDSDNIDIDDVINESDDADDAKQDAKKKTDRKEYQKQYYQKRRQKEIEELGIEEVRKKEADARTKRNHNVNEKAGKTTKEYVKGRTDEEKREIDKLRKREERGKNKPKKDKPNIKDMTADEKRAYDRERKQKQRQKEGKITVKDNGKKIKDMTVEERREYNNEKKRAERAVKKQVNKPSKEETKERKSKEKEDKLNATTDKLRETVAQLQEAIKNKPRRVHLRSKRKKPVDVTDTDE